MKYKIAIASLGRCKLLKETTLKYLKMCKIPSNRVYIFVADKEEYAIYTEGLNKYSYNKIVIAERGMREVRNFIRRYFKNGEYIISIDDDVKSIMYLANNSLKPTYDLKTIIKGAYINMNKSGSTLWGVYPVKNHFFMSLNISVDLKFILGCFYGFINSNSKDMLLREKIKTDYETTLLHFNRDNSVLRYNYLCIDTKVYSQNKGGIDKKNRNIKLVNEAVNNLVYRFPHQVKINNNRKSRFTEILLRSMNYG